MDGGRDAGWLLCISACVWYGGGLPRRLTRAALIGLWGDQGVYCVGMAETVRKLATVGNDMADCIVGVALSCTRNHY